MHISDAGGTRQPTLRVGAPRPTLHITTAGLATLRSFVIVCCLVLGGCWSSSGPEVVVYTALDTEFSEPILHDFSQKTGITASPKFDTESTKTVGLATEIIAESGRPRCDVFWNNEILNTLRLEQKGLLVAYHPPVADNYPAMYRSPKGFWHGFAARARVLVVNTKLVPKDQRPTSILDLTAAKWRGRCGMGKPLVGTTATHAACLFATWGPERAEQFFQRMKDNQVQILSGNKDVALQRGGRETCLRPDRHR